MLSALHLDVGLAWTSSILGGLVKNGFDFNLFSLGALLKIALTIAFSFKMTFNL